MGRRARRLAGVALPLALLAGAAAWRLAARGGVQRPAAVYWGRPGTTRPGTFNNPRCVAATPDGQVHVLDLTGRLQRFDGAGAFRGLARMPTVLLGRPQDMAADAAGNRWVADTHYHRVVQFGPDDEIVRVFGTAAERPENARPGQLYWPCSIAVAPDGTVYTGEYGGHDRIQYWSPAGEWRGAFGRFGEKAGEFRRPSGLAFGPDGLLYVADAANHRIQVFTPDGTFVRQWAGARAGGAGFTEDGEPVETEAMRAARADYADEDYYGKAPPPPPAPEEADLELYYPYGVAAAPDGRVFVVESGASRVQWFAPDGTRLGWWGGAARGPEGLWAPWHLALGADGGVWVADTHNCRVLRVPVDGGAR